METLQKHIEIGDPSMITSEVRELLNGGFKRFDVIGFIINTYCQHYVNKNLWVLQELYKVLSKVENNPTKTETHQLVASIAILVSLNPRKSLHIYRKDQNDAIREILFTAAYVDFPETEEFKQMLHEEAYGLMNIVCGHIKNRRKTNDVFAIISYLIACPKNRFYKKKCDIDPIDHVFILLMKLAPENDIGEYTLLCKDIFYYRIKKKDKLLRINLLFYSVFVMIGHNVSSQQIEYKTSVQKEPTNYDYLFIKFDYDKEYVNQVCMEKEMYRATNRRYKQVDVQHEQPHDVTRVILE